MYKSRVNNNYPVSYPICMPWRNTQPEDIFKKMSPKKNTDQVNTYLGINSDDFATLIAIIGKYIFIAFDTVRMIVS